jgi:hypothetical protein
MPAHPEAAGSGSIGGGLFVSDYQATNIGKYPGYHDTHIPRATMMIAFHLFNSCQCNIFDENAEKKYNTIAALVMAKHHVLVLDLHAHVIRSSSQTRSPTHTPNTPRKRNNAVCR